MSKTPRMYGTWPSPITPDLTAQRRRLNDLAWAADDTLVWSESRGAQTLVLAAHGSDAPILLSGDKSVRGQVGYGGGEFTAQGETVVFVADGRLYRTDIHGSAPRPLTPAFGAAAAPAISPDGRWVAYVHTDAEVDGIAIVDADGTQWPRHWQQPWPRHWQQPWPRKLAYGTDFAMQPTWSPDGRYLAYAAWDFPHMPWDAAALHLLSLDADAQVTEHRVIAGGPDGAVFQPTFSPDGRYLAYACDESGSGQLYVYDLSDGSTRQLTDTPDADHMTPAWIQGLRTFAWGPGGRTLFAIRSTRGVDSLLLIGLEGGAETRIDADGPYTSFRQIAVSPSGQLAVIASSAQHPDVIVSRDPMALDAGWRVHSRSFDLALPPEIFAPAQPITWTGHDGGTVHGLYYPPTHPHFSADGPAPLVVEVHGGPTSQRKAAFDPNVQFFATRGYGVLSVNYRGSTGYGRDYMRALYGDWGGFDVEDAASGAQHLVDQGLADPQRLVIYGGSAGGLTVLLSLVRKPGFYRAGVSLYGVADQFALAQDTHKFERRYNDLLLGPLPQAAALYRERSPLFHADSIRDALLVFQGADDGVVPPNQSEAIVAALRARGVPVDYHLYAGEGHGFRKPETLRHFGQALLDFLTAKVIYV